MAQRFRRSSGPASKGNWGHLVILLLTIGVAAAAVAMYMLVQEEKTAVEQAPSPAEKPTAQQPTGMPGPRTDHRQQALPPAQKLRTPEFSIQSCNSMKELLNKARPLSFDGIDSFLVGTGVERDLVWRALHSAAVCHAFHEQNYTPCAKLDKAFPERMGGRMNCGFMARSISAVALCKRENLSVDQAVARIAERSGAFSEAERSIVTAITASDPKVCDEVLGYRFGRQLPQNCKAVVAKDLSLCKGQEPLDELRCTQITKALLDLENNSVPSAATGNLFDDIAWLVAGKPADCDSYARSQLDRLCGAYAVDKAAALPPTDTAQTP